MDQAACKELLKVMDDAAKQLRESAQEISRAKKRLRLMGRLALAVIVIRHKSPVVQAIIDDVEQGCPLDPMWREFIDALHEVEIANLEEAYAGE